MQEKVVDFIDSHRGQKPWYLVPRAQYWNKQNIGELQQVLGWMDEVRYTRVGDLEGYQPELGAADEIDPDKPILQEWDQELQLRILDKMVDEGIISAPDEDLPVNDQLANLRNHFNLLRKLGFGYRNKEGKLFISDVGVDFIEAPPDEAGDLIERQLIRLQFLNPSLDAEGYDRFRLFPYLFTLRLLRILPEGFLTTEEFSLFVVHAENDKQLDHIADLVTYFRSLPRDDQLEVVKYANLTYPQKANARVHLGLFGATPTLVYEENQLNAQDFPRLVYLVEAYIPKLKYVEYERFEDWYSYIGSSEEKMEIRDIVTYYTEIGQDEKARQLLDDVSLEEELEEEAKSLEELFEEIFSERILEEALEKQPAVIEDSLRLIKNGRQYRTDVGPIDLLCQDGQGRFVVVELKKGRTEDKVVGQTLRYMGWVKLYLSPTDTVRGIIVGRHITDKLKFAMVGLQHPEPIVHLKQFDLTAKGQILEVEAAESRP